MCELELLDYEGCTFNYEYYTSFTGVGWKKRAIDKATLTFGPSQFSAYADEATILKFLKLRDVGAGFGLKDGPQGYPDAYAEFGGGLFLEIPLLTASGELKVYAQLNGYYYNIVGIAEDLINRT